MSSLTLSAAMWLMFLDRFDTILAAYESGAMKYGCFIAHKSPTD